MNEAADKLCLSEDLSAVEGRRFRIKNLEAGLPDAERRAVIEAAEKNRDHYIFLFDPEKDVRIGARCQVVNGEIQVSQANLDRTYAFRRDNGAAVKPQ